MSVVVDASVVVALLVADERQPVAREHLRQWLDSGESLHAPAVMPYELANVLARRVFDGAFPIEQVSETWADVVSLGITLHPFDLVRDGAEIAAVTAQLRRRHATDSAYVCLARQIDAVMWTLDGALARNAQNVELPVKLMSQLPG